MIAAIRALSARIASASPARSGTPGKVNWSASRAVSAASRWTIAARPAAAATSGERDVLVVDVEDRPGTMGEVGRRIGEAGVSIELA
jgi:hypothetical protein